MLSSFKPSRNHCPINCHCPLLLFLQIEAWVKFSISGNQHCNRLYVVIVLSLFWTQNIPFKCPKDLKQNYVLYFERIKKKQFFIADISWGNTFWTFLGSCQTFHHCLVLLFCPLLFHDDLSYNKSSEGGLWMIYWLVEERTVCLFSPHPLSKACSFSHHTFFKPLSGFTLFFSMHNDGVPGSGGGGENEWGTVCVTSAFLSICLQAYLWWLPRSQLYEYCCLWKTF